MKSTITILVKGNYETYIQAPTKKEARIKADALIEQADFGELIDVKWQLHEIHAFKNSSDQFIVCYRVHGFKDIQIPSLQQCIEREIEESDFGELCDLSHSIIQMPADNEITMTKKESVHIV